MRAVEGEGPVNSSGVEELGTSAANTRQNIKMV